MCLAYFCLVLRLYILSWCVSPHKLLKRENKLDECAAAGLIEPQGEMDLWKFFLTLNRHSGHLYCSSVRFNVRATVRIGMNHTGSLNRGVNHTLLLWMCVHLQVCVCGHMSTPHAHINWEAVRKIQTIFDLIPFMLLQQMNHNTRQPESWIVMRWWWWYKPSLQNHTKYNDSMSSLCSAAQ